MASGQGKKGKGMGMDFDSMWEQASGGKTSFAVKDYTPKWGWEPAEKVREKMIAFLVKNGKTDGTMTKDLFLNYTAAQQAEQFFGWTDADKDGKISLAEAKASAERSGRWQLVEAWDKYDKDKKGYITMVEYTLYMRDRLAGDGGGERGKGKNKNKEKDGEKTAG